MSNAASIHDLARSLAQNTSHDAFAPALSAQQWDTLGNYLQPFDLAAGERLIDQDGTDRTLFFLEHGALSVHALNSRGQVRLAILSAGSVVGEGAFFSRLPRAANVQATGACRVWRLTPIRFTEMTQRQPDLALALALALGAVVARRLGDKAKRIAVT
ncbi:MAG: Crp/Fnr family transcriptional regulator [Variovorax sp.]|nr:Crp/Fnr family transcriptional regulator [Variovorax sp.]